MSSSHFRVVFIGYRGLFNLKIKYKELLQDSLEVKTIPLLHGLVDYSLILFYSYDEGCTYTFGTKSFSAVFKTSRVQISNNCE